MKLGSFHALISLTLTIFILSNLQHVNSLGWYPGNELRDLEWTGNSFIYSEVPNWYASSLVTSGLKWSVCAGNYLLGGYNILGGNKNQYFERYYSGLPGHNQVNIKFMFFPIDSWDGTTADDHFEVYVDGNSYYAWRLSIFSGYGQPLCGGSWNDFPPLVVKMSVPHTSSGLTFRVVNMLDQASDDESMGFRDVSMTFVYVGSPAFSFCGKADDTPLPDRICPCATGTEYMNPPSSGNCFPCNSACVTCDGGATTDCLSCTSNKYLSSRSCYDCSYNCLTCNTGGTSGCLTCQPSYPYMINGNTCVSTCNSPLYTSVSGSNTNCYTPCPGQYALWDGQCSAVCPSIWLSPRTYNTFAVCDYPCSLSQYLYYDGVCDNSCPSPLTVRDFHGRNYCDHTCSTTSDYLYWDVLCESYCNYPLTYITTHGRKICQYPCAQSQYLYWDQTCGNSCFFPQIIRTFHGKNFCDFPCTGGKFLYWNNTCISTCPAPLITRVERGVNYCDYPCSGTQYLFWNGSCLATCNAPLSARVVGSSRFCDYPCQTYEILHWLGTCVGSCAFPRNYVSEGSPARLFCYYMCTTSQYLYWNGTCSNTCNAPLVNVISESRNFCTYPCSVGDFLYWNGSCKSSCPSPLKTRLEASLNYCDYPCVGSEYLYWNGSCIAACNTPLSPRTTNGNLFCDYPCSISWYLYWEGTCRSSCPSPLVTRYEASRYYCDYPCQTSEYLYWNSSCKTTCGLFSPSTDLTKKFCNFQCYYLDYIYWDKSCSSSCAFPLTSHTEGSPTRYFCDFPCDPSEYLYWNGSCITTCDFPLSPTNHNSRKFCNQPCSSSYYLYWNGSCILTCPFPLVTRVEGSRSYCDYPCLITEYLYWNGSCISTCNSPLVQRPVFGNNFCDYPCSNTAYYLYWDGACGSSCSSPLTPVSEGSPMVRKFCLFTCQSNEYIYWNGTCSTSCAYPLTNYQANSRSFCTYPCSLGQYLYWNQGCGSSCPAPHNTRVEGSRNFCDYPCLTSQYLYWNGTCSNTCNAPLTNSYSNSRYYCHYPCSGSDYLYWNGSCLSTCVFPHSTRLEAGKNYCDYPCTGSNILYWNGSCIATCAFPLKTRYEASKYYCDYPCTLSQYLYWNGSCLSGCVFPLSTRVDASRNYCDYPCPAGKYLYWNGTCMSACAMPLDIRIDAGDKYCDYKCTPAQILYWDGVCSTQCPSPRTLVTEGTPARNYCTFTCKLNEFLYWNGTCATTCKYPLVNKITSSRMFCEYPCTYPQFLNWDRTCIDACPLPFMVRREAGLNYCDYPCASNEYLYWNGSCYSSCASPLIQRVVSNNKFCDFTCTKSTDFLYWDGTCSADCASPLTQVSQGTVEPRQYCVYSCKTTEYLYWNGSCLATCPSPLTTQVIKGRNICNFPCDPSKFLYWDGTCSSLCPAPLTSVTEASRKYCRYKCSATQYLTWDGLCSLTCDYPYSPRAEKGLKYCDYPCDPAGYLYWNNTCSMTCQDPFVPRVQKAVVTRNFCDFPCSTGQYYATWTSKCRASCLSPYNRNVSSLGSYCSLPCNDTTQYYYPELGACKKECKSPYVKNFTLEYPQCYSGESDTSETGSETAGGMLFNALLVAPAGNGTLTLVKVVKAMQYMRYLDIKLPPRLERFGSSNGRGIMSLASNSRILDKIADSDVVKGTIPDVFATHHPDTSFIVNFWGTILFVVSAVGAAVLFTILEKISKKMKWELAELIFVRMRVITRLNLVIMLLASSIDDVILYGSIEIRSLNGSTSIDYASLAVSIVFIGLVGAVMVGSFLLARKQQKIKNSVAPEKQNVNLTSFETKWQDFQVMFRGFKGHKKLNPYFFFLYTIRIGFPMLITVCATTLPMIIISVQVITSVLILGYLFIMKPFKKRINQVQLVIYELIVLVMNVCMLFLTIFSVTNTDGGDFSVVIGDIVIIGNDCLNLLNLVFFVFRVVIEARVILRYNRSLKVKKGSQQKTRYIQLLALVFQQVNMGFEELIEEYPTQDSENVALKSKRSLKDVEGKSFIVEKTETHLYTQIEKTNENKTLPQNFDKSSLVNISGFNKEDTWMPAIEGGYTGQPLETTILKQEQRKPDYRQAGSVLLSPSQPRYDRLSSETSPLYKSKPLKKEEDVKVFNFDSDNTSPLATDKTRKSPILRSALSGIVEEKGLVLEPMESPKKVMLPPMPSVYQVAVEEKASPTKDEKSKKFLNYNWQGVSSPESTTNLLSPVTSKNTIQIDVAPKKVEEKAEKAVDGKRVEYLGDYIQDEPAGGNYKWKNSGSPKPRKGGAPGKSQEKSVKK